MTFCELAAKRYSCRKFSDKKVPQELMDQIIAAGIHAPTAKNLQPYHLFSLDSAEAREKVCQVTPCTFGADRFLVVGSRKEGAWVRPSDSRNFSDVDGAIVATHLMMAIEDLGLATTWVGYFDAPKLKELFPQMADYDLIAIFPIGYAAEDAEPGPMHASRNPVEEMLTVL